MKHVFIATIFIFTSIFAFPVHALTLADINLLISVGIIPAEKAAQARAAFGGATGVEQTAIVQSTQQVPTTCASLTKDLLPGARDIEVVTLQKFLQAQGHYTYPEITGFFGDVTREAVIRFQLAQGMITSRLQPGAGTVGPTTRAAIKTLTACPTFEELKKQEYQAAQKDKQHIEVLLNPYLQYHSEPLGEYIYRYRISARPSEDVVAYRLRFICADAVTVDIDDFEGCGHAITYKVAKAKETFMLRFTLINDSGETHAVGVLVEALNQHDVVLGSTETIHQLVARGQLVVGDDNRTWLLGEGVDVVPPAPAPATAGSLAGCTPEEIERMRVLWTNTSSQTMWGNSNKINVHSLSSELLSGDSARSRIEIIQPNGRKLVDIVEQYKDTHLFPDTNYLRYLLAAGKTYNNINKLYPTGTWLPYDETEATLERKRRQIQTLVPSIPLFLTTADEIAKNRVLLMPGEIYKSTSATGIQQARVPGAKWGWQGREFGIFFDKYRVTNGTIASGNASVCQSLSDSRYGILLIRK